MKTLLRPKLSMLQGLSRIGAPICFIYLLVSSFITFTLKSNAYIVGIVFLLYLLLLFMDQAHNFYLEYADILSYFFNTRFIYSTGLNMFM